jgi:translation initiation factor IF-3
VNLAIRRLRVNERIRIPKVRLISSDGKQLGIVPKWEALRMAREEGLDLVEVAPNVRPPVCKIMDYGKYVYDEKRKEKVRRQKQHVVYMREIKIRVKTQEHDYQVKLKKVREFLSEGNKVKISLRFRGREIVHIQMGKDILKRFATDLSDISQIESPPRLEGKQLAMIVIPTRRAKDAKVKNEQVSSKKV